MISYAHNGTTRIAYETFGDPGTGEPLLLIMGLDFQMVWWPDDFCELLVANGFAVARFDNRDTGLSDHFESPKTQNPFRALAGGTRPVYTGADMINDGLAVMAALGWDSAHVAGGSMGSALAQGMALLHPGRVRSLTLLVTSPLGIGVLKTLSYLKFKVFQQLRKLPRPSTEDEQVELLVGIYRIISSPGYPFPEDWARRTARISHQRAPRDPRTTQRHLAATRATKYPPLSTIAVPTLVVSGADDPLMKPEAGAETARRIPGAEYVSYPGMGHNLPAELWPDVVKRMRALAS